MIGKCPHCGINLTIPPFNKRNTNEVMIVMIYRNKIDCKDKLRTIIDLGYCEICEASLNDLNEQQNS